MRRFIFVWVDNLAPGWQQGNVTIEATDGEGLNFSEVVTVKAYYGSVEALFLPVTVKGN